MSELQIQADLQALAGRLTHRASNTDSERVAAEYLRDRFKAYAPNTEIDDFYSIDTPWFLFCSYWAEFTIIALIAVWWPRVALCYGAAVFLAYLAEFSGYRILARFVPQFETQNVVARFLSPRPMRVLVVMAHYDSAKQGPLERPRMMPWLRELHFLVLLAMLVVLFTCAVQALGLFADGPARYEVAGRWVAAALLLAAAGAVAYNTLAGEPIRGANDNASGTAALLRLAERLAHDPIPEADVHLVATGSSKTWMNGARQFVMTHKLDRQTTYFLNIDRVGIGEPAYTTREGMLHGLPCSAEMIEVAQALASEYGAAPCRSRAACSDLLIPLSRGYQALGITCVEKQDKTPAPRSPYDTLAHVDDAIIRRAADFAEAIVRRLAAMS